MNRCRACGLPTRSPSLACAQCGTLHEGAPPLGPGSWSPHPYDPVSGVAVEVQGKHLLPGDEITVQLKGGRKATGIVDYASTNKTLYLSKGKLRRSWKEDVWLQVRAQDISSIEIVRLSEGEDRAYALTLKSESPTIMDWIAGAQSATAGPQHAHEMNSRAVIFPFAPGLEDKLFQLFEEPVGLGCSYLYRFEPDGIIIADVTDEAITLWKTTDPERYLGFDPRRSVLDHLNRLTVGSDSRPLWEYSYSTPASVRQRRGGTTRTGGRPGSARRVVGGFRFQVGGKAARDRQPKQKEKQVAARRVGRRGLARRIAAAKKWHQSSQGARYHRALGDYNRESLRGRSQGFAPRLFEDGLDYFFGDMVLWALDSRSQGARVAPAGSLIEGPSSTPHRGGPDPLGPTGMADMSPHGEFSPHGEISEAVDQPDLIEFWPKTGFIHVASTDRQRLGDVELVFNRHFGDLGEFDSFGPVKKTGTGYYLSIFEPQDEDLYFPTEQEVRRAARSAGRDLEGIKVVYAAKGVRAAYEGLGEGKYRVDIPASDKQAGAMFKVQAKDAGMGVYADPSGKFLIVTTGDAKTLGGLLQRHRLGAQPMEAVLREWETTRFGPLKGGAVGVFRFDSSADAGRFEAAVEKIIAGYDLAGIYRKDAFTRSVELPPEAAGLRGEIEDLAKTHRGKVWEGAVREAFFEYPRIANRRLRKALEDFREVVEQRDGEQYGYYLDSLVAYYTQGRTGVRDVKKPTPRAPGLDPATCAKIEQELKSLMRIAGATPHGESLGEADRSREEIARWTGIIKKTGSRGVERLRRYLGSLALGRDFDETMEAYLERKGLVAFDEWAQDVVHGRIAVERLGEATTTDYEPAPGLIFRVKKQGAFNYLTILHGPSGTLIRRVQLPIKFVRDFVELAKVTLGKVDWDKPFDQVDMGAARRAVGEYDKWVERISPDVGVLVVSMDAPIRRRDRVEAKEVMDIGFLKSKDPYTVMYAWKRQGPVMLAVVSGKKEAERFLDDIKNQGGNGTIFKGDRKNESLGEGMQKYLIKFSSGGTQSSFSRELTTRFGSRSHKLWGTSFAPEGGVLARYEIDIPKEEVERLVQYGQGKIVALTWESVLDEALPRRLQKAMDDYLDTVRSRFGEYEDFAAACIMYYTQPKHGGVQRPTISGTGLSPKIAKKIETEIEGLIRMAGYTPYGSITVRPGRTEGLDEAKVTGPWPKSRGHLAFLKGAHSPEPYEFYLDARGELWRAPVSAVIDIDTGYRIGRWEAPKHMAKRMFDQAVKAFESVGSAVEYERREIGRLREELRVALQRGDRQKEAAVRYALGMAEAALEIALREARSGKDIAGDIKVSHPGVEVKVLRDRGDDILLQVKGTTDEAGIIRSLQDVSGKYWKRAGGDARKGYKYAVADSPFGRKGMDEATEGPRLPHDFVVANQPTWQTVNAPDGGTRVEVLRVKDSKYVAVPESGRRNARRFAIVEVKHGDYVTQVNNREVVGWLVRAFYRETVGESLGEGINIPKYYAWVKTLKVGDEIEARWGRGNRARARITGVGSRLITAALLEPVGQWKKGFDMTLPKPRSGSTNWDIDDGPFPLDMGLVSESLAEADEFVLPADPKERPKVYKLTPKDKRLLKRTVHDALKTTYFRSAGEAVTWVSQALDKIGYQFGGTFTDRLQNAPGSDLKRSLFLQRMTNDPFWPLDVTNGSVYLTFYRMDSGRVEVVGYFTEDVERVGDTIVEGINDPYIFKAVFLAGGPGSGKSFIANQMFAGTGLKFLNSDLAFEYLLRKRDLPFNIDPKDNLTYAKQMGARGRAKEITDLRKDLWLNGMLGLVVDGTGRDYDKISHMASNLKALGYDTSMVFVNTTLDVAKQRNLERERSVPEEVVVNAWQEVQSNMGKFQAYFGGDNFVIVDNSKALDKAGIDQIGMQLRKKALKLVGKPVKNPVGKAVIDTLKRTGGRTMSDLAQAQAVAASRMPKFIGHCIAEFAGLSGSEIEGLLGEGNTFFVPMGDSAPAYGAWLLTRAHRLTEDEEDKLTPEERASIVPKVFAWLQGEADPCDDEFHAWAESQGLNVHKAEAAAYDLAKRFVEMLTGGKSKGQVPAGIEQAAIDKGVAVEYEHTGNKEIARKIALDHLTEFPNYYEALAKMEADLKAAKGGAPAPAESVQENVGVVYYKGGKAATVMGPYLTVSDAMLAADRVYPLRGNEQWEDATDENQKRITTDGYVETMPWGDAEVISSKPGAVLYHEDRVGASLDAGRLQALRATLAEHFAGDAEVIDEFVGSISDTGTSDAADKFAVELQKKLDSVVPAPQIVKVQADHRFDPRTSSVAIFYHADPNPPNGIVHNDPTYTIIHVWGFMKGGADTAKVEAEAGLRARKPYPFLRKRTAAPGAIQDYIVKWFRTQMLPAVKNTSEGVFVEAKDDMEIAFDIVAAVASDAGADDETLYRDLVRDPKAFFRRWKKYIPREYYIFFERTDLDAAVKRLEEKMPPWGYTGGLPKGVPHKRGRTAFPSKRQITFAARKAGLPYDEAWLVARDYFAYGMPIDKILKMHSGMDPAKVTAAVAYLLTRYDQPRTMRARQESFLSLADLYGEAWYDEEPVDVSRWRDAIDRIGTMLKSKQYVQSITAVADSAAEDAVREAQSLRDAPKDAFLTLATEFTEVAQLLRQGKPFADALQRLMGVEIALGNVEAALDEER